MNVVRKIGVEKQQAEDREYRFSTDGAKRRSLPPEGVQLRSSRDGHGDKHRREHRVHHVSRSRTRHVSDHEDETSEASDVDQEFDEVDPDDYHEDYESGGDYDSAPEDDRSSGRRVSIRERHESESEHDQGDGDLGSPDNDEMDEYLHALVSKDGKGVCYEFAKTGKCKHQEEKGKCIYSHDSEDIEKFKAAQKLGPSVFQQVAKQALDKYKSGISGVKQRHQVAYNPGPKGTSPGVRPTHRERVSRRTQHPGRKDA